MALKVELKPNERILIGESVITNCNQRSWLVIEGTSPILREKDILTAARADTPAKRIYLAVQLMYTSRDPRAHHEVYFALVRQIVQAAPAYQGERAVKRRMQVLDQLAQARVDHHLVRMAGEIQQGAVHVQKHGPTVVHARQANTLWQRRWWYLK